MAEAVIKRLANARGAHIDVSSRGLIALTQAVVHPLVVKACRTADVEIEEARLAKRLQLHDVRAADLILVMDQAQRSALRREFVAYTGKVYTLGHWHGMTIEDPLGGDEKRFLRCLIEIQTCAATWLERLRDMGLVGSERRPP